MSDSNEWRPELVFAFVGAAGVRLHDLRRAVDEHLKTFGYVSVDISVSNLLQRFSQWEQESDPTEFTRIKHRQEYALRFRRALQDGAALARGAIASIREKRAQITGSPNVMAASHAFLLDQLKHPAEVALLREVYGPSFFLIAGHAPLQIRQEALAEKMALADGHPGEYANYMHHADKVIQTDGKQEDDKDLGQNTRDTYPLADFFANLGRTSGEFAVKRFIDLIFAHPFHTPFPDEFSMYQASAVALRSSDENRQVGAVIVSLTENPSSKIMNADVVASGMNEVPRRGGGFYWHDDSPDGRDQWLIAYKDEDRALQIKASALQELIERISKKEWLVEEVRSTPPNELARALLKDLKGTQFMNIGEFMRPVHAEMAAIIDGARRGVSVNKLTMYVTTFPCHNCAKHIIAAGIRRVIYLEPYPKSRAKLLHGEEIDLTLTDTSEHHDERVAFMAFSGVAPRQYHKLFSMTARGGKNGHSLKVWPSRKASIGPRCVPKTAFSSIIAAESEQLKPLRADIFSWNEATLG